MTKTRPRILITAGAPATRQLIALALRQPDRFDVVQTSDRLEALQEVERLRPDVVIVDLEMPGLGGMETIERVHAFDAGIVVLVICAFDLRPDILQRALVLGATDFLVKPVSPEKLLYTLRTQLAKPRAAGGPAASVS